jgi:sortase A
MRGPVRVLGAILIAGGALTLGWAVLVWQWQDPFTAIYTHFQQVRLATRYERRWKAYDLPAGVDLHDLRSLRQTVAAEGHAYGRSLRVGDPVGRLKIGRIGLKMIVVQGTDHETLKKGPGHYLASGLPGEGRLIYVAGHRTTYLAPFARINDIRNGDYMTFEVPYGTFEYRAFRHYVVSSDDSNVLLNGGREILRLQACHPRFFATHRYIVDARLVAFNSRGTNSWVEISTSGERAS